MNQKKFNPAKREKIYFGIFIGFGISTICSLLYNIYLLKKDVMVELRTILFLDILIILTMVAYTRYVWFIGKYKKVLSK